MNCTICGSKNWDGALDESGLYVCVDCWANGEAFHQNRTAVSFVPANVSYHVNYPSDMQEKFINACNHKKKTGGE